MERLTERRDAQYVIPLRKDGKHKWALCKAGMSLDDSTEYLYGDHAIRLAAYEDTGLEPCDYAAMKAAMNQADEAKQQLSDVVRILGCSDIACLKGLIQAEKDLGLVKSPSAVPLTLEELREMDGEPVWIELLFNEDLSSWAIIDLRGDGFYSRFFYADFEYYGDEWLAYRRKPEEGKYGTD